MDDARAELDEAAAQLETARADLQAGWDEYHAQIAEAETQIRSVVDRLTAAIAQADESAAQLNTAGQQIAQARAEVNAQQQELNSQQQNLNQAQQEIDAQRAALENANAAFLQQINSLQEQIAAAEEAGEDTEALVAQLAGVQGEYDVFMETVYGPGWAQLDAKQAELTTASSQLASAQDRLNSAIAQINQKQAEYDAGAATLAEGRAEIARQQQTLDAARAELDQERSSGAARLEDAAAQIDEQQQTYDDAVATFAEEQKEALAEIDEKTAELDEAQADLDALEAPTYTVADRRDFPGYEQFGDNSTRIDVLSRVFPVFLFAIAALVSLTTMTRMVEEERITNGTLSALGYTPTAIRRKYLVYGVGASLLGAIVGLILGHTLLPTVIFNAYAAHFIFPSLELSFYPLLSLLAILIAVACTVVVAAIVATRELREMPASLLLPKPPTAGTRILLERVGWLWKRMSFTHKVTARNLFRYKKRMFMTIFGIAGYVSLLIAGFGLRDSLAGISTTQFDEILHYDLIAVQQDDVTDIQKQDIDDTIEGMDEVVDTAAVHYEQLTTIAGPKDAKQDVTLLVPGNSGTFDTFVTLRDRASGAVFSPEEDGVIVSEKLASLLNADVGDTITLDDADGLARTFPIGAITEMYVGHYVFLDDANYQAIFQSEPEDNALLITLTDSTTEQIDAASAELMSVEGIRGVVQVAAITNTIEAIMNGLNNVIAVLIVASVLLALVVIFNLTNINVSERIRELSTIKVLGFYPREVTLYIYRETFILTLLGILAGYAVGIPLHAFIIDALPPDNAMFRPDLLWANFALSATITLLISVAIMVVIHIRLKRVDMLEALKSVE